MDQSSQQISEKPKTEDSEYNDDDFQILGQLNDSIPLPVKNDLEKPNAKSQIIERAKKSGKQVLKTQFQSMKTSLQSTKYPEYQFSKQIRQLYKQNKYKELVTLVSNDKSIYQEFDAFRYHGEVYNLNQNVMVNNANNENEEDYIAQIIKIIQIKEKKSQKFILISLVKWYYRKMEIVKFFPEHKSWISTNELFRTDQTDYILTSAIYAHCKIVSFEDYEKLQDFDGIYFGRLKWIPLKNKIQGYENILKFCLCRLPINPELDYIQCDECDEWYHMSCVGAKKNEWDHKEYICGRCR